MRRCQGGEGGTRRGAPGVARHSLTSRALRAEALSNNQDAIVRFAIKREGKSTLMSVVIVRTPLSVPAAGSGSSAGGAAAASSSTSLVSSRSTAVAPSPSTPTSGLGSGLGAGAGTYSAAGHGGLAATGMGAHGFSQTASGYESGGYSSCGSVSSAYDSAASDRYESDASSHSRSHRLEALASAHSCAPPARRPLVISALLPRAPAASQAIASSPPPRGALPLLPLRARLGP